MDPDPHHGDADATPSTSRTRDTSENLGARLDQVKRDEVFQAELRRVLGEDRAILDDLAR